MQSPQSSISLDARKERLVYEDEENQSVQDDEQRQTLLGRPHQAQSLWQSVNEYTAHVTRPRTRGAAVIQAILFIVVLLFAISFLLLSLSVYGLSRSSIPHETTPPPPSPHADASMDDTLRALFKPTIPAFDGSFETVDGTKFTIDTPAQWTTPLGSSLCIVNTDTRPMNETDQPWASGSTAFNWRDVSGWSGAGYLNQYLYSRIHGYRYIYVQTAVPAGYSGAWARPGAWRHVFEATNCRIVVYADSDVIYANVNVPFEWMLNHWGIPENTSSITMSLEPVHVPGWDLTDQFGKQSQNPGFTVIHNAPGEDVVPRMLTKWANCLTETDYPGCARLKKDWPAEMGGFNDYVRHDPDFGEIVHKIPCAEALGWPEWDTECKGLFLRHYTLEKGLVKPGLEESLARPIFLALQKDMVAHKGVLFDEEVDENWVGVAKESVVIDEVEEVEEAIAP